MLRLYSIAISWLLSLFFYACSTTAPSVFGKQSLRDQYSKKLTDAGLNQTALGRQWFTAAKTALQQPVSVTLPYKEFGYFAAEKPRAVAVKFSVKRGEKLMIQITKRSTTLFALYTDFWKAASTPVFKTSFDTTSQPSGLEIKETGDYILRLQPELLSSGEYTLSISTTASLGFPVAGGKARIGSIWGAARDAGARRHEGIDIFAPKRTPAIAAANGIITTVNENALGGKVVWLRPKDADYVLYYAHLDEQLVHEQQVVRQGDTVGLVGNTGNARTTPSHLHFGVYATGGAIDPLPFVNPISLKPQEVDTQLFQRSIRLSAETAVTVNGIKRSFSAQTIVYPLALTASTYRVQFPDGMIGNVPIRSVQSANILLRYVNITDTTFLWEEPNLLGIRKRKLFPATRVRLIGYFQNFALVQTTENEQGWVVEKVLPAQRPI